MESPDVRSPARSACATCAGASVLRVDIRIPQRRLPRSPWRVAKVPANRNVFSGDLRTGSLRSRSRAVGPRRAVTHRRPSTRPAGRAPRCSRATTSADIRSSSCAHTAERHATVTTPPRSATGVASRGDRSADGLRPVRLDRGERRAGRQASAENASRATATRAWGAAPHAARRPRAARRQPRASATQAQRGRRGQRPGIASWSRCSGLPWPPRRRSRATSAPGGPDRAR